MDAAISDPAQLLESARALYPKLRERASQVEAARKISPDSFQEMKEAGLFRMTQPKAYGGAQLPYHVFCEAVMEIAQGCPSTGWIYAVIGEHNVTLGAYYPRQAQDDVWAEAPDTYIGSGNSPELVYTEQDDGWLVNGQLRFSSGCEFVTWHMTGGRINGRPGRILFPQAGNEIIDSWNSMGLAGTGSHDVKLNNVRLPDHRICFDAGPGPWFNDTPLYRQPQWSTGPFCLAAAVVGAGQGALRLFIDMVSGRNAKFGAKVAEFQSIQLRIAEAAAELDAARRMILGDLRETHEVLESADEMPVEMRARNLRDMAFAPVLAKRAVDRLFYASGAESLDLGGDLQRYYRDVNAGAQQICLNWDANGTVFGRIALGMEPGPVRW